MFRARDDDEPAFRSLFSSSSQEAFRFWESLGPNAECPVWLGGVVVSRRARRLAEREAFDLRSRDRSPRASDFASLGQEDDLESELGKTRSLQQLHL